MNAQEQLLVRRWILRSQDPQLYYEIKDHQKELRRRFQDKFGYALIINPLLAKLEKIPGQAQAWMGIQAFESIREYQMFCYLLMFLEDKEIEEQFILSTLTEYVALCFPKGEVSWNSYQCRRQLIHVLQYAVKSGLIKVTDGDGEGFLRNEQQEVLYENSGISRYFIINQRIIAGNAQFTGIAAGRGVGFTTGLLLLREGLGMRETPIRPHSWH